MILAVIQHPCCIFYSPLIDRASLFNALNICYYCMTIVDKLIPLQLLYFCCKKSEHCRKKLRTVYLLISFF